MKDAFTMNILQCFFGLCAVTIILGLISISYNLTHPRRKKRKDTMVTYNLDTKKFGIMYNGFCIPDNNEEKDDENVETG